MDKTEFHVNKLEWIEQPRDDQDRAGKIRLHPSGKYVNPLDLRPEDIDIRDVAHHLSLICRYTGGAPAHYSVAQHSVMVVLLAAEAGETDPFVLFNGLMHDGGEYVFNDIASPVKKDPRMKWYGDLEHDTTKMIIGHFGGKPELLGTEKPWDHMAFEDEVAFFLGKGDKTVFTTPPRAEAMFLGYFHDLQRQMGR